LRPTQFDVWQSPTTFEAFPSNVPFPMSQVETMARKTPSNYKALAVQWGYTWLGPEVSSVMEKTGWQCAHGHTWQARYNDLQQGHGCLKCAHLARAMPPEHYHALAAERGYLWLGPEVSSVMKKTRWQCGRGHIWQARYNDLQQGKGCLKCFHLSKVITPDQYHALAASRGYTWLGPDVSGVLKKTKWKCARGHIWRARYNDIQQGYGCPRCARLSRTTRHT